MLVRLVTGAIIFAACTIVLVLGYDEPESRTSGTSGGVRSPGSQPGDYRRIEPEPPLPPCDALTTAALIRCEGNRP